MVEESNRLKIALNLIVIGISLYAVSQKEYVYQETSAFENLMIDSFAPMQRSVSYVKKRVASVVDDYVFNVGASRQNKILRNDIAELKNKLFQYNEMVKENTRLKNILKFSDKFNFKKVLAQVVAWDSSSDFKVLRINKGTDAGVKVYDPVVTALGVVGYVYRVTDGFSDVLTILDQNNRVDGIIERTRSHGILHGHTSGVCKMKYVSRTEPVVLKDRVFTSGLGNIFPKGLILGYVSKIERESYGITQNIEIEPAVNFNQLEEVLILLREGEIK